MEAIQIINLVLLGFAFGLIFDDFINTIINIFKKKK